MTRASEPAGLWVRVSTADQSETNQVPDIERHCAARHYAIVRRYELNDKSASKGEQQSYQDQVIEDVRDGVITVLVCWNSDRIERRGPEALFKFLRQIKDAGGRLESTTEPLLGTEDISGEAMTALSAVMAHQESVKRSNRQRISIDDAKSRGALYSIIPWGFVTEGEKNHKHIVPTDLCREVVPKIFDRCIDGWSLARIAEWLDAEGIPTRRGTDHWSESTVRWVIRQRAYAGRWVNRHGETIQRCEKVVSPGTFDRAQAALKNRKKRGPSSKTPPLLAKLECLRCGAPMYRNRSGNPGAKRYYYRCYGRMPQRKGCGNAVLYEATNGIVTMQVFMISPEPYSTREWVEGTSYDDEISDVKQRIREATSRAEANALWDKLEELQAKNAAESTQGHYERTYMHKPDGSLVTVGDYFQGLDHAGQREYIAKHHRVAVEKVEGLQAIHLVVDDTDYGVYPATPEMAPGRACSRPAPTALTSRYAMQLTEA